MSCESGGFEGPNSTQTPDAVFDYWLTRLTGGELRVLLFLIRRTYGWKREHDDVSVVQFVHGIADRHGNRVAAGVGVGRSTVISAVKRLVARELIDKTDNKDRLGADEAPTYRLRIRDREGHVHAGPLSPINTTQIPDAIFDYWLPHLSDGELAVLLYIVRRTIGFGKRSDIISPQQFLHGITTRDGLVLDEGCGVSKGKLYPALARLADLGLISVVRRIHPRKGNLPSRFALVFAGELPSAVRARDPRLTGDPTRGDELTPEAADAAAGIRCVPVTPTGAERARPGSTNKGVGIQNGDQRGSKNRAEGIQRPDGRGYRQRAQGVHADAQRGFANEEERVHSDRIGFTHTPDPQETVTRQEPAGQHTDAQETAPNRAGGGAPAGAASTGHDSADSMRWHDTASNKRRVSSTAGVEQRVAALSAAFGDDHRSSSLTRVRRLQQAIACSDAAMLELLDQAAIIARAAAGAIRRRNHAGERNAMPFLLATLENLVPIAEQDQAEQWPQESARSADEIATSDDDRGLWGAVKAELRLILADDNYRTWIAPTRSLHDLPAEGTLHVTVSGAFHRDWLEHRLASRVAQILARLGYPDVRVAYLVGNDIS